MCLQFYYPSHSVVDLTTGNWMINYIVILLASFTFVIFFPIYCEQKTLFIKYFLSYVTYKYVMYTYIHNISSPFIYNRHHICFTCKVCYQFGSVMKERIHDPIFCPKSHLILRKVFLHCFYSRFVALKSV